MLSQCHPKPDTSQILEIYLIVLEMGVALKPHSTDEKGRAPCFVGWAVRTQQPVYLQHWSELMFTYAVLPGGADRVKQRPFVSRTQQEDQVSRFPIDSGSTVTTVVSLSVLIYFGHDRKKFLGKNLVL